MRGIAARTGKQHQQAKGPGLGHLHEARRVGQPPKLAPMLRMRHTARFTMPVTGWAALPRTRACWHNGVMRGIGERFSSINQDSMTALIHNVLYRRSSVLYHTVGLP